MTTDGRMFRFTNATTVPSPIKGRMFGNRVLRRIFGHKRDEVTGNWKKLHNEELTIGYSSQNIIRQIKSWRIGWVEQVAYTGEDTNVYRVLMRKPEGKRPLGRPRRRWENGITMELRGIGWGCGVDSVGSG
jgi:hypothetical protein